MSTGFSNREIAVLNRIRSRFLDGSNAGGGYWQSDEELALYDTTFAERIGWKWDAVLRELAVRNWTPRSTRVFDFGCGSGVASRRVVEAFPSIRDVILADVSARAMSFAERRMKADYPEVNVSFAESAPNLPSDTLLVVSHVLNELPAEAHARLMILASQASEILWVEAGTHADSRMLSSVREVLRGQFSIVAPCPHSEPCGILAPENERHWCHFFTSFPSHAAQDARWSQLGRELGIDLRALPYSFLAMQKAELPPRDGARFIGTPVEKKGHFEVLVCEACGVRELCAQKRDVPDLFKALRKRTHAPAYRIVSEGGKITTAAEL